MSVGLVIVSHSGRIADGVVELAAQMAPTTTMVAAGGTDEGGIGTSFDRVTEAVSAADGGDGVLILCDLGSAILTAETVLDFLDDDARGRVVIADAPLVEGTVAAAVAAEGGGTLTEVRAAAESAGGSVGTAGASTGAADATGSVADADETADTAEPGGGPTDAGTRAPGVDAERTLAIVNPDGLHARPAAELVRLASRFTARLTVNGVDTRSLLGIMALGLRAGGEVTLTGTGPDADAAVSALADLIASGFGEAG